MKMLRYFFVLCIMASAYNVEISAQASSASRIGKTVKEFIKKTTKSTGKSKNKSNFNRPTRPRITTTECGNCRGNGKVNVWNQYYGCWQTQTCYKCNGTGRVRIY